MTENKNSFDKLTPSDQVAIESMVKTAKAEELIDAYRQKIAKETLKKRPISCGEIILIIIAVILILGMFILPTIKMTTYEFALRGAGPELCKARNSTFVGMDFHSFTSVKIICADFTMKLP